MVWPNKIDFHSAGQAGIVKDVAPHELPPPAWSDGRNVIFRDGKISKRQGHEQIFGTPAVAPYWNMFAFTPTNAFWMYSSLLKVYATDGAVHSDITRAVGGDYGTQAGTLWNGGVITGIPVITNNVDVPQMWTPVSLGQRLQALTAWPATDRCRVIKPFKNFLVALAITRSAVLFGHMVKWSHPAVPGSVPSTWDVADTTKQAGEVEIGDEFPGDIRDGLALRDSFFIYKNNSVWAMQFIGGQSVFRFTNILSYQGILDTHCVALVREGRSHIVGSPDDFYIFDGQNAESVLDDREKKWLEDNIEIGASDKAFVFAIPAKKEAWYCIPTLGNTYPNVAMIWNWQENTITFRDLPANCSHISMGALTGTGDIWDSDSQVWDADAQFWDVTQFRPGFLEPLMAVPLAPGPKLYAVDHTFQFDGVNYTAFVERTGLACTGQDRITGQIKSDPLVRKLVNRLWIKASGAEFTVKIGGQEDVEAPVIYVNTQTFNPATQKFLDLGDNPVNTPLIALRFEGTGGLTTIDGFSIELELLGNL